ncbi:MAG: ABC transporter permease [PVC group bacterium]|nr:ABC transporter permease [PVC group bacterium]
MFRKIFALLKKDLLIETSYKLSFILNIFGVFVFLLVYFFIDKMFNSEITEHLKEFGVNYFSYVLLSMAFFSYIGVGIGSFTERIRDEQTMGTLESLLLTPTRIGIILASMALWNLIFATFNACIYICLGAFLFHIDFTNANLLSAGVILLLTIICFSSLGILSASFIIVFKRGNPVAWIINNLEGLLGGVFFPITVMPPFLQMLAKLLPITYAIRAMELAVYQNYSLAQLSNEWGALLIFSIILIPLSFGSFQYALKKARKQGSLIQY